LFFPNNSMVQRRITFTLHSFTLHSCLGGGFCTLPVPSLRYSIFFFVLEGDVPSTMSKSCFVVIRQKIRLFASRTSCR
jgi:hypothetical protein